MKYVRPEIELIEVRKEDIITLSYMLPEMPIEENTDVGGEENGKSLS